MIVSVYNYNGNANTVMPQREYFRSQVMSKYCESESEGELSPRDQGSGKVPRAGYNIIVVAIGPQIFLSFYHIL